MKTGSKIKKMCEHCFQIKKGKKMYNYCKSNPRHKQRTLFSSFTEVLRRPSGAQLILESGSLQHKIDFGVTLADASPAQLQDEMVHELWERIKY